MGSEELVKMIQRLAQRSARKPAIDLSPGCPFGVAVNQRLADLDRSLGEVQGRLNGLLFLVVGAVIVEIVLRLIR